LIETFKILNQQQEKTTLPEDEGWRPKVKKLENENAII